MSDKNKEIVEKINAAFTANNTEGFLEQCSDDVEWTMIGDQAVVGKDAIRTFMAQMEGHEPPVFTVDEMIASDDSVACYGGMKMKDADGKLGNWNYCDIYRIKDGKVTELRSFVIKQKDEGEAAAPATA